MASGGKDVADGAAAFVTDKNEAKISGSNSKRAGDKTMVSSGHVHSGCNHGRKLNAEREEQVPNRRTFEERPAPAPGPARKERIEDVFQDEIVMDFMKMSEFKKFARSQHGLCLREYDIENTIEDNRHSNEEAKMQMLSLWKQKNGKRATAQYIRQVADSYRRSLEDYD